MSETTQTATLYTRLGVDESADPKEIRSAYQRLIRAAHPDRQGGDPDRAAEINDAYTTLKDPARRSEYDRRLRHERSITTKPEAQPRPTPPVFDEPTFSTTPERSANDTFKVLTVLPLLWTVLASLAASVVAAIVASAVTPAQAPARVAVLWGIALIAGTVVGAGAFAAYIPPRRNLYPAQWPALLTTVPLVLAGAATPAFLPKWAAVAWLLFGTAAGYLLGSMAWDITRTHLALRRIVTPRSLREHDTFGEPAPGIGPHLLGLPVEAWALTPGLRTIRTATGPFPILAIRDRKIAALTPVILPPGRYFWSGTSLLRQAHPIPQEAFTLQPETLLHFQHRLVLNGARQTTLAAVIAVFPSTPGAIEFENEPPGDYILVQAESLSLVHDWLTTDTKPNVRHQVIVAASL